MLANFLICKVSTVRRRSQKTTTEHSSPVHKQIMSYAVLFPKIWPYNILMKIEHTLIPTNQDIDFLTQQINAETSEFGSAYPFAFFIRNDRHEIIAGCNGSIIFGSIYTDQLWVHPEHRKSGLGHNLMEKVHHYGRENRCHMATVATMTFQNAAEFYQKLGYVIDFERPGYAKNASCIFLKKNL
jgi:ribosomal protein S18 acetylase RimI-like enzyme